MLGAGINVYAWDSQMVSIYNEAVAVLRANVVAGTPDAAEFLARLESRRAVNGIAMLLTKCPRPNSDYVLVTDRVGFLRATYGYPQALFMVPYFIDTPCPKNRPLFEMPVPPVKIPARPRVPDPVVVDFSSSGDHTFEVPAGVALLIAECWGGSGNGGNGSPDRSGGGGGGGAYVSHTIAVIPEATINLHVGGIAGDSWVVDNTTVLAKGGATAADNASGQGGQASASIGTTKFSGGNGGTGEVTDFMQPAGGGGGGSSASPSGNGNAGQNGSGGVGGSGGSLPEGGTGGNGASDIENNGSPGTAPGGGGGGGSGLSGGLGAGAIGKVRITYTAG